MQKTPRYGIAICTVLVLSILLGACGKSVPGTLPLPAPSPIPPQEFPPGLLHLGWTWPQHGSKLLGAPAIGSDGTIYVADEAGFVHAVSPRGEEQWHYQVNYRCEWGHHTLLEYEGIVYYLTEQGIHALNKQGTLLWDHQLAFRAQNMLLSPEGDIYVWSGSDWARFSSSGIGLPFSWPEGTGATTPAFDSQGNLYVWAFRDEEIWVLAADGKLVRNCGTAQVSHGLVTGPNDTAYYIDSNGDIVALSASCEVLWRYSLVGGTSGLTNHQLLVGTNEVIYVGGQMGRAYAFDVQGKLLWESETDPAAGDLLCLSLGDKGILFALDSHGALLAFDQQGKRVWYHELYEAGQPSAPQVTSSGELTLLQNGRLHLFTGDPALFQPEPTPVPPPQDIAQAEQEIVSFMAESLCSDQLHLSPEFSIIWAAKRKGNSDRSYHGSSIRTWKCSDGHLTEEKAGAEDSPTPTGGVQFEESYTFSIHSISEDGLEAEVYFSHYCGPLCGAGYSCTLRRSPSGRWWVTRSVWLWIS